MDTSLVQGGAQRPHGVEHACLDRAEGKAQALGDLGLGEVLVTGETHHFEVCRAQGAEGLVTIRPSRIWSTVSAWGGTSTSSTGRSGREDGRLRMSAAVLRAITNR